MRLCVGITASQCADVIDLTCAISPPVRGGVSQRQKLRQTVAHHFVKQAHHTFQRAAGRTSHFVLRKHLKISGGSCTYVYKHTIGKV